MRGTVNNGQEKFRELIVYIANKTGDDPRFGDIKLNKILYFADFRAYEQLGQAITGVRYQKLELGPAPRALLPVREELEHEGAVRVSKRWAGRHRQTVTKAVRDPDTDLFTDAELALVDEIIDDLRARSADDVSDLSHEQSPGWNLVELGEDIPYSTALIDPEPPSPATLQRSREIAAQLGW